MFSSSADAVELYVNGVNDRTRLVCFTLCSNIVGTMNDTAAICEIAHAVDALAIGAGHDVVDEITREPIQTDQRSEVAAGQQLLVRRGDGDHPMSECGGDLDCGRAERSAGAGARLLANFLALETGRAACA